MAKDDSIKRIGDLVGQLFPDQAEDINKWIGLHTRWKKIVGEGLDCHSRAREVIRGMLLVDVDHPAWMNLFQLKQDSILQKLQKDFPELTIMSIRLRLVGDLRQPLSESQIENIETTNQKTDENPPEGLKEALESLFKTIQKTR